MSITATEARRAHDEYRNSLDRLRTEPSLSKEEEARLSERALELRVVLDSYILDRMDGTSDARSHAANVALSASPADQGLRAMLAPIDPQKPLSARVSLPIGVSQRAALIAADGGAGSYGSYAVPDASVYSEAVTALVGESAVLAAKPRIINTTSGETIDIPVVLAAGMPSAAYRATEETVATIDDIVLSKATLTTYELSGYLEVGENFFTDTSIEGAYNWIGSVIGAGLGAKLAVELLHGTGSSAITGALYGATSALTSAASDSLDLAEIMALRASIAGQYRGPQASYIMTQDVFDNLLYLRDASDNYLIQPALQAGEPDRLYGHALRVDSNGLAMATGRKCCGFGRWDQAYAVRFAGGLSVEASDAPKYTSWIRTFRYRVRVGAAVTNSAAAKVITQL